STCSRQLSTFERSVSSVSAMVISDTVPGSPSRRRTLPTKVGLVRRPLGRRAGRSDHSPQAGIAEVREPLGEDAFALAREDVDRALELAREPPRCVFAGGLDRRLELCRR